MGMQMVITGAQEQGTGIWVANAPPHQLSMLGQPRSSVGARSILLVHEPTYDQASLALRFDADDLTVLNLGSSNTVVVLDLIKPLQPRFISLEGSQPHSRGRGDEEFLSLVRSELHGPARDAAERLLQEVRARNPGDLVRGQRNNFKNYPDNFWYVIVQPTAQSLSITVRGAPDLFRPTPLDVKDDRPGYTRFKLSTPNDIDAAVEIIEASRRKRPSR
jgi:hypothetical protein